MSTIPWYDFLATGHGTVDDDHRQLVTLVNRLADPERRREHRIVLPTIRELRSYAAEHFAREEELMASVGWLELADHRALHADLVATVDRWQESIEERWHPWRGGSLFVVAAEWLVRHIVDEDCRVGVFCRTGKVPGRNVRIAITDMTPYQHDQNRAA